MSKTKETDIIAILWDYDGTLVDSARKNMAVTIEVLRHFDPDIESHLPTALQSYEAYQIANHHYRNWRELYTSCYGIPIDKLDEAGSLWTPEQERSTVIPDMFPELASVLLELKNIPMGICSQNDSGIIRKTLEYYGVSDCFQHVIGYADIPGQMQKPHPYGFCRCAEILNPSNKDGTYLYIGDHSDDVAFGKNGAAATGHDVICITTDYLGLNRDTYSSWKTVPEYYVESPKALRNVIHQTLKI